MSSASRTTISLDALLAELTAGTIDQFWNVLTDAYFDGTFIPGSRRVALDTIGRELSATGLAKDARIVVYCGGPLCPQSHQAVEKLRAFGHTNVIAYEGGLEEWAQSGRTLTTEPEPTPESASARPATKGCACCAPRHEATDTAAVSASPTAIAGDLPEVRITVKGGYSPSRVTLEKGVRTRLVFAREESSRCSEELVIADFGVRRTLPPHAETVVELTPAESGTFDFSCGMNMLRGALVVA